MGSVVGVVVGGVVTPPRRHATAHAGAVSTAAAAAAAVGVGVGG